MTYDRTVRFRGNQGVRSLLLLCCAAPWVVFGAAGCTQPAEPAAQRLAGGEEQADANARLGEKGADDKEAEADAADRRKLAKLERDLDIAKSKLAKAEMAAEHATIQHRVAVAEAERALDLERRHLRTFTDRSAPNRIEWSGLGLARAEDRVQEAVEELEQLELMYAEEDFADQTKEIVLERGRRRLERSRRDLELRREDHAILTEQTIPIETREHEMKVETKAATLEKAERAAEASRLDTQIAIMSGGAEIARLEAEIKALEEKIAKREKSGQHEEKGQE